MADVDGIRKLKNFDLSTLKSGLKAADMKTQQEKSIFDAIDKDNNGVIDEDEVKKFKEGLDNTDVDGLMSNKEGKKFLKDNNLDGVKKKDIKNFLAQYGVSTENVENTEIIDNNGTKQVQVNYKDGSTTTFNSDKSFATETRDENGTTTTKAYDPNNVLTTEKIEEQDGKITETKFEEDGKTPSQKTVDTPSEGTYEEVSYENGKPKESCIISTKDGSVSTVQYKDGKPEVKEVVQGTNISRFEYLDDGTERITSRVENKGNDVLERTTDFNYAEDGTTTATTVGAGKTTVLVSKYGKPISETTTEGNKTSVRNWAEDGTSREVITQGDNKVETNYNADGKKLTQTKTVDGKEYSLEYDGVGNTKGVVVQNGESISAIAKKFGVTKQALMEANQDKVRGNKTKFFNVGDEIKIPRELEADDKSLQGRKSSDEAKAEFERDEQIRVQKRAEAKAASEAREAKLKEMGLINHEGEGEKVQGDLYNNGKKTRSLELTKIGNATHGRTIAQDKSGKVYVVAHNGAILKNSWVEVSAHRKTEKVGNSWVATEARNDGHGRKVAYNADGKAGVMSQDGKMLKTEYVQRSDYSDVIRTDSETARNATLDNLTAQLDSAKEAFNAQLADDGWAADVADGVSNIWGWIGENGNQAWRVREDLAEYKKDLNELKQCKTDAEFKTKFKEKFGVEYSQKAVADYTKNPTEENFKKAFGTKRDIATRVAKYNASQQSGGEVVKGGIKLGVSLGAAIATRNAGLTAVITAAGSAIVDETDRMNITGEYVDADGNIVKKEGGAFSMKEGVNHKEILTNAAIDGAMVFAGGTVAKFAGTVVKGATTAAKVSRAAINATGDITMGATQEYIQTGNVSASGTAMNAAFGTVGMAAETGALRRAGQKVKGMFHKDVKGDVNNHRDIIAGGEVARNTDQSHLNANERQMIEQGIEDVPAEDDLAKYQRENGYEPVSDADKPAYQAYQEQVAADYADAHKLENNAVIKEQKAPSVPKETIDKLQDEIKGLDGSVSNLQKRIEGAKRFGKNTEALEKQLANLQGKRAAKAAELEAAQKPKAQWEPEVKADTPASETPKADVKADATPESVKQSANNISDTGIPVEHKELWQNCKKQIDKITDELKNFKGDVDAMLLKCENLFADLRTIAKNASESVKNKINKLIEDLRSMLTTKNLPNVDETLTPSVTSQHRMEMGQIGNSISRAKNLDDLNKLQASLDQIPECSQKAQLQKQLNARYAEISEPKVEISQVADYSNSKQGTRLPKNKPVTLQGTETLELANYDLDLSSPQIQSKLNAMKNGDVITVGRNASGVNDIKIDGSFITVSGKHLQIEKFGDKFVVTDLSTNGTTIGKSIAHVSGEIKTTFGHQTVDSLADLKPGEITSIVKGDIRYTIENHNGQIKIASRTKLTPSLNEAIRFDEIRMSNRTPNGKANPGKTMGELLTPQQKKVYSDSLDAFEKSKNKKIIHNANDVLTTDNMLHGTDIEALLSKGGILDKGLVPREISGNSAAKFTDGSVPDTLTPLCSDVWDIRQNATIKDYFDANNSHWNNDGESNFLPNSNQRASSVVIVFDKKSIDPTIIDNSFGVNNSGRSILFENGNMSRGHNYPTHRAIPIGAPANSIDRIIVDTRIIGQSEINELQQKIKSLGLDIKLYDLNGSLLSK